MTSSKPTVYLVDGSGLVHRSFHAVRNLSTRSGQPTGAIYGFTNTIRALMNGEKAELMIISFDLAGKTFRDDLYTEYKANRQEMDRDLVSQWPFIDRICEALRLPVVSIKGYEADDVIATLSQQAVAAGHDVVVVSSDKDLLQLVSDHVIVMAPGRDGKSEVRYDRDGVIQKMGVPPERVVDLLALMGDSVDNVPGVKGIGDKGARDLLQQFGSLDALLEQADSVKRAAYRDGLKNHREEALLSRKLVTLDAAVPVSFSEDAARLRGPDKTKAYTLFKELEFTAFARDVAPDVAAFSYRHITADPGDRDRINRLVSQAVQAGSISMSLRMSSARPMESDLIGLALCVPSGEAIESTYFEVGGAQPGTVPAWVTELFANEKVAKWTAWGRRDLVLLGDKGVGLGGSLFDASLAAYLLSPGRRGESLHELAVAELGLSEKDQLPGEAGAVSLLEDDVIEKHTREAAVLSRLVPKLRERLEADGVLSLFETLEVPVARILAAMERVGVLVDADKLKTLSLELVPEIERLAGAIYAQAGRSFNILSPVQLRQILFEEMGLESGKKTKETKELSTADDVLEELAKDHEFPRLILEYRAITKLKSTYVDALPQSINPRTGRIHASFRQNVAATGRLSATDPNLQNIPIRTATGRRVREAFIAPEGAWLLSADYSQIELRILAHLSLDPILIETFERAEDVHDRTSLEIFGPFTTLPREEQRRRSKMVNYALLYGKTAFTLARDIGITRKEADAFIHAYFDRYPKVRAFIDASIAEARETGMVRTIMGRLRRFPDIRSKNVPLRLESERQAVNTRVQGSAADLIKKAMIDLDMALRSHNLKTRLVSQIHDELLLETPDGEKEEALTLTKSVMESAMRLRVPLGVDARLAKTWSAAH